MKFLLVFILGYVLFPVSIAAEVVIVNQYGGTKSQLLEFSNGKPQSLWDTRKSGKIKKLSTSVRTGVQPRFGEFIFYGIFC